MQPLVVLFIVLLPLLTQAVNNTIASSNGIVYSPNYPGDYDNNLDDFTTIQASIGNSIILTFLDFYTEEQFDNVMIYDGGDTTKQPDFTFSGDMAGSALNLTSNLVVIRFKTDMLGVARGFAIQFETIMNGKPFTVKNQCEYPIKSQAFGFVTSPNWPYTYPNDITCGYQVQSTKSRIFLEFVAFYTEDGYDTCTVYDGKDATANSLGTFSGNLNTFNLNSTGQYMYIVFKSDMQNVFPGFSALFESID